MAELVK